MTGDEGRDGKVVEGLGNEISKGFCVVGGMGREEVGELMGFK
jgi:hypothetical protein